MTEATKTPELAEPEIYAKHPEIQPRPKVSAFDVRSPSKTSAISAQRGAIRGAMKQAAMRSVPTMKKFSWE